MADHSLEELEGRHVHHKNGYSFDDRPSNLEVLDVTDHHQHHAPDDVPEYSSDRRRELAESRERDEKGRFR